MSGRVSILVEIYAAAIERDSPVYSVTFVGLVRWAVAHALIQDVARKQVDTLSGLGLKQAPEKLVFKLALLKVELKQATLCRQNDLPIQFCSAATNPKLFQF